MFILSIALGGCIKGPPIEFGITVDTGGHITYALGAAQALAARDDVDRVEIVTRLIDDPALGAAYAVPFEPVSPKLAIRRIDTGHRAYMGKATAAIDRPGFVRALIAQIELMATRPDVIHAHFADAAEVAMLVRERLGIPFIYTAHSLGIEKAGCLTQPQGHLGSRIAEEDRAIGAADAVVASSRDEAERQLMLYPSACPARIHCVPPGAGLADTGPINLVRARALIAPFLRSPNKPILLAIARPVAKKNLAGLIDLFAGDARLRRRANLVIVAGLRDGPESGEDEQRSVIGSLLAGLDTHDLYGTLALPKRHSAGDVVSLYALARESGGVFVNPAFTEPYGLTLTEAALHGLPVVATCHGGPTDIVARLRHGRVADPRDHRAFAGAINALLDDRTEWAEASSAGRINADLLDWGGYAARFVAIVRSLRSVAVAKDRPSRLLLCDIDNTLTGCTTGAVGMAAYLAAEQGLAFGVATGRSLQEAQRLLAEWGQPDPDVLITSVGAEIYWRKGGRLVADAAYAQHIDAGWNGETVHARVMRLMGVTCQPAVEQRRHKRSYFVQEPAVIAAIRDAVADLPVRVIHSHGRLLDIVPERAGKGAAMAWAARAMGISRRHVYAAGDSGNDLDMLDACHNGILVANHSAELAGLVGRPTIYLARSSHATGVVEGMQALMTRAAA